MKCISPYPDAMIIGFGAYHPAIQDIKPKAPEAFTTNIKLTETFLTREENSQFAEYLLVGDYRLHDANRRQPVKQTS